MKEFSNLENWICITNPFRLKFIGAKNCTLQFSNKSMLNIGRILIKEK